jgi:hypothetical protein
VVRIHDRPLPLEVRPLRGHDDFERFASYRRTVVADAGQAGAGGDIETSAGLRLMQVVRIAEVVRDSLEESLVLRELRDGALRLVV